MRRIKRFSWYIATPLVCLAVFFYSLFCLLKHSPDMVRYWASLRQDIENQIKFNEQAFEGELQ